jgi:DNA polymerase-3 subunit epsilon
MVFFDLETTGTNISTDRIVEISVVKVMPDGSIDRGKPFTKRINPTIPIPAEATAVHHITNEDVADCPTFKQVAANLKKYIEGCDFCGFNSNRFDLPLLAEELIRAGVDVGFLRNAKYVDVQNIFHKKEERTLVAAYRFYCGKELEDAHSASADTMATYEVLCSQLERYDDLENSVEFLSEFSSRGKSVDFAGRIIYDDNGVEVFSFGKYKGLSVEEVFRKEPSYYDWIMNGDFPNYTKKIVTEIKLRTK